MTTTIDSLRVNGAPATLNSTNGAQPIQLIKANRPISNSVSFDRTYQFVLKDDGTSHKIAISGLPRTTNPVRKMEHLSRVRTANKEISTMDSPFIINGADDAPFVIDKPHFVLCGLPVGSKDIQHHLYVNEARVGNFKTSAKAVYEARRGTPLNKAFSEPSSQSVSGSTKFAYLEQMASKSIPPIPPTTPVSNGHVSPIKPKTAPASRMSSEPMNWHSNQQQQYQLQQQQQQQQLQSVMFHGTIPPTGADTMSMTGVPIIQKKLTLLRREHTGDSFDLQREHSSVSTRSSIETIRDSVVNNSLTVTTGKKSKFGLPGNTTGHLNTVKVNYNNPYRNTKYKERMALSGEQRFEFSNIDSYLKYQKQQLQNGRHIMTPRAILRIPKPCSDTFLLQMMHDMNHPKSRRSGPSSAKYSDIAQTRDLEDFVHSRTSSSLSKTQSNLDRYMARKSKSGKSSKSTRSALDTDTIEEESNWEMMMRE